MLRVTDDIKIKAIVTSSDVAGNIYQEVALQDATGAIIVSVAQGGQHGPLPIGTEVLVSLKDLYVGNYGKQAQIGVNFCECCWCNYHWSYQPCCLGSAL